MLFRLAQRVSQYVKRHAMALCPGDHGLPYSLFLPLPTRSPLPTLLALLTVSTVSTHLAPDPKTCLGRPAVDRMRGASETLTQQRSQAVSGCSPSALPLLLPIFSALLVTHFLLFPPTRHRTESGKGHPADISCRHRSFQKARLCGLLSKVGDTCQLCTSQGILSLSLSAYCQMGTVAPSCLLLG